MQSHLTGSGQTLPRRRRRESAAGAFLRRRGLRRGLDDPREERRLGPARHSLSRPIERYPLDPIDLGAQPGATANGRHEPVGRDPRTATARAVDHASDQRLTAAAESRLLTHLAQRRFASRFPAFEPALWESPGPLSSARVPDEQDLWRCERASPPDDPSGQRPQPIQDVVRRQYGWLLTQDDSQATKGR